MKNGPCARRGGIGWQPHALLRLLFLWLYLLALASPASLAAQQTLAVARFAEDLPDAPIASRAGQTGVLQALLAQATSSQKAAEPPGAGQVGAPVIVTGIVSDLRGGLIAGAKAGLSNKDGSLTRETITDAEGRYTFASLPAGTYTVTLSSPGLETVVLSDMAVTAGDKFEVPEVPLPIARTKADIEVFGSQEQVAAEQLQIQEHQRVFGVFPNFYTSFVWDAAPLNRKQKFSLMFHATLDPVTFLTTGLIAGVEQARNTFPGYNQGAEGYAKRYGAAYGDNFIGRLLGAAAFPALFKQDPRYFYMGEGSSVRQRAVHAITSSVICRGGNGHRQLYYSHILGNFAAGGIANLYHPGRDRGAGLTVSNASIGLGGSAVVNLVREFALRTLTSKVPAYAKGKPRDE